jgi:GH15 family glucan-1,4-alpha-glucosidase
MARPVMLGNGSLTVGLNQQGMVHDFYYPYVGLDNLATSRRMHHMIGVWVDDEFSWLDDGQWKIKVDFETEALVSKVHFVNTKLQLRLELVDFVDYEHNIFFRKIKIFNKADIAKDVRLFMHQVFQISRGGRADTALYEPDEKYILDYKGRCCLLIYGQDSHKNACDQFAIGNYGIEGKEGTFKDAEDGELSGSAVEHGGVDSVMRFSLNIKPQASSHVDYWIIAADSQYSADKLHQQILKETANTRLAKTRQEWHEWLGIGANVLHSVDKKYLDLAKKSLLVTKAHIDRRGGIIASCDSSIYNYGRDYYSYVWPRDGAYAIWPLIRLGYTEEPKKFFEFCRDTMNSDGYLMHKYQPDRAIGSTWHPLIHNNRKELAIQQDETSIVLYMLGEYLEYSQDLDFIDSMYEVFVQPAANFFVEFIDEETGLATRKLRFMGRKIPNLYLYCSHRLSVVIGSRGVCG